MPIVDLILGSFFIIVYLGICNSRRVLHVQAYYFSTNAQSQISTWKKSIITCIYFVYIKLDMCKYQRYKVLDIGLVMSHPWGYCYFQAGKIAHG